MSNELVNQEPQGSLIPDMKSWFSSVQRDIADNYESVFRHHGSGDIQRSGHTAESIWIKVLKRWLPSTYAVVGRSYIVGPSGHPFEMDIVVLEPGYPVALREENTIHFSGVAAAFSVKSTLRHKPVPRATTEKPVKGHLEDVIRKSRAFSLMIPPTSIGLENELTPPFPVGLLAHSSDMEVSGIASEARDETDDICTSPRQCVDLICVADRAFFRTRRFPKHFTMLTDVPTTSAALFFVHDDEEFGAVAHFIIELYRLLGKRDSSLKKLAEGMGESLTTTPSDGFVSVWQSDQVLSPAALHERNVVEFTTAY